MAVLGINHIAFRTPDPVGLRAFYFELLDAEPLAGSHDPTRAGSVILVFFASEGRPAEDPDEIAFDVDSAGFARCSLARGRWVRCSASRSRPMPGSDSSSCATRTAAGWS